MTALCVVIPLAKSFRCCGMLGPRRYTWSRPHRRSFLHVSMGSICPLAKNSLRTRSVVRIKKGPAQDFCTACWTKKYPTKEVTKALLRKIEHERLTNKDAPHC